MHNPDGAGIGAGHVPRFSPGFVHVFRAAQDLRWPAPAIRLLAAASRSGEDAGAAQGAQRTADGLLC